jgi:hypothetical protein
VQKTKKVRDLAENGSDKESIMHRKERVRERNGKKGEGGRHRRNRFATEVGLSGVGGNPSKCVVGYEHDDGKNDGEISRTDWP